MATKCVEVMHRMPLKDRNLVVKEIRVSSYFLLFAINIHKCVLAFQEPERFFRKVKEETGIDFMANRSGAQSLVNMGSNGGGSGSSVSARANYETYGLSPTFLKQLGIEGPLCSRVFAANVSRYHC